MAKAARIAVGLEIDAHSLRAVEVRRTVNGPQIERVGEVPTPEGAVRGDNLLNPQAVAEAARKLFQTFGFTAKVANVGLPGRQVASRLVELPAMPERELRGVIAGEVDHYRLAPPGQGMFDYLVVDQGGPGNGQEHLSQVLLLATEKRTTESYQQAVAGAGAKLGGLEPLSLAAVRGLWRAVSAQPMVAVIAVELTSSSIMVLENGQLRYHRRIDTGLDDLLAGSDDGKLVISEAETQAPAAPAKPEVGIPKARHHTAAGSLGLLAEELRRSLEYYQRERPQSPEIERALLVVDNARVKNLESYLSNQLAVSVELANPLVGVRQSSQLSAGYLEERAPVIAGALGLALRGLDSAAPGMRMVDLSTEEKDVQARRAPQALTIALILSILLVVAATIGSAIYQMRADAMGHTLIHQKERLALLTAAAKQAQVEKSQDRQAEALASKGVRWSRILAAVSWAVPSEVGMVSLYANQDGAFSFEGETPAPAYVAQLMDRVNNSPLFVAPGLAYLRREKRGELAYTKFEVRAILRQSAAGSAEPAGTWQGDQEQTK